MLDGSVWMRGGSVTKRSKGSSLRDAQTECPTNRNHEEKPDELLPERPPPKGMAALGCEMGGL
jgi:hypothetical protein